MPKSSVVPPQRIAFGARIRDVRLGAGLSQEAAAELAGIHRTYWSSLERGRRNVGIDNVFAIASALGVEAWELF